MIEHVVSFCLVIIHLKLNRITFVIVNLTLQIRFVQTRMSKD